jgi:Na+-transporting NADH:ubiquinone oxidoreductase subunit B
VRDRVDLEGVFRAFALAMLPCLVAGAHGLGRDTLRALQQVGLERAPGWRGDVLAVLGVGLDADALVGPLVLGLLHLLPLLLVAALVGRAWAFLFARVRGRPEVGGHVVEALVFTLLVPPTLPLWQAAVGMSFGVVLGKEVFGGGGRNLVHPAVTAAAFLLLAWPASLRGATIWVPVEGLEWAAFHDQVASGGTTYLAAAGVSLGDAFVGGFPGPAAARAPWAAVLGGLYLLARRLVAWRTIVAVAVGVLSTAFLWRLAGPYTTPLSDLLPLWHLVLGSLLFGAVFLATDPVTTPVTHLGRWIHGLLLGGVVVLLRTANPAHPEGTVLAVLLGSVFAPLNDAVVVTLEKMRRRRHG